MSSRLTDTERERMTEFAQTPMHERSPEQLLPENGESED
jgi:hypothetical protein